MRILAFFLILLVPPALYFTTQGPTIAERDARDYKELLELDLRLDTAKAAELTLPQFRQEAERLETELHKLRRILPPELDQEDLSSLIGRSARANEVQLISFEADEPEEGDQLDELSVDCEIEGTTAATTAFFRSLENTSIVLDLPSAALERESGRWHTSFTLVARSYPDPADRATEERTGVLLARMAARHAGGAQSVVEHLPSF